MCIAILNPINYDCETNPDFIFGGYLPRLPVRCRYCNMKSFKYNFLTYKLHQHITSETRNFSRMKSQFNFQFPRTPAIIPILNGFVASLLNRSTPNLKNKALCLSYSLFGWPYVTPIILSLRQFTKYNQW